jgi:hypothetical protein
MHDFLNLKALKIFTIIKKSSSKIIFPTKTKLMFIFITHKLCDHKFR